MATQPQTLGTAEGELVDMWNGALEKFEKKRGGKDLTKPLEYYDNIANSPKAMLTAFTDSRHPDDRLDKVCRQICDHISGIRDALNIAQFVLTHASVGCPYIAPAGTFISICGCVLTAASRVRGQLDQVQAFFGDLADKFRHFNQLDGKLNQFPDPKLLKERIVKLFTTSLEVCGLAIEKPEHRFRDFWKFAMRGGDDKFADAHAAFKKASEKFYDCLFHAGIALTVDTNQTVSRIEIKADLRDLKEDIRTQKMEEKLSQLGKQQGMIFQAVVKQPPKPTQSGGKKPSKDPASKKNEDLMTLRRKLGNPENQALHEKELAEWFVEGSCEWFLKERYQVWSHADPGQVIWVHGAAGLGKTFLSLEVARILGSEGYHFARFFFREDQDTSRSLLAALKSMVYQLAVHDHEFCRQALAELDKDRGTFFDKLDSIQIWNRFFAKMSKDTSKPGYYLIFDGIDEADDDTQKTLTDILGCIPEEELTIRILITGRERPEIETEKLHNISVYEELTRERLKGAFKILCRKRIRAHGRLKKFRKSVRGKIVKTLSDKADSMLYIENMLLRLDTIGLEQAVLRDIETGLPENLDQLYDMMVKECHRGRPQGQSQALKNLFAWLAFSKTPLTLQQAAELTKLSCHNAESLEIKEEVMEKLSGILEIVRDQDDEEKSDDEDEKRDDDDEPTYAETMPDVDDNILPLQFQERRLREYFQNKQGDQTNFRLLPSAAHLTIFTMCIDIICRGESGDDVPVEKLRPYAGDYWDDHLEELSKQDLGEVDDGDVLKVTEALCRLLTNVGSAAKVLEKYAYHTYKQHKWPDGSSLPTLVEKWVARARSALNRRADLAASPACRKWLDEAATEGGIDKVMIPLARAHAENWLEATHFSFGFESYRFAKDAFLLTNEATSEMKDASDDKRSDEVLINWVHGLLQDPKSPEAYLAVANVFMFDVISPEYDLAEYVMYNATTSECREKFDKAFEYYKRSLLGLSNPVSRFHAFRFMGMIHYRKEDNNAASACCDDALSALESLSPDELQTPENQDRKRDALGAKSGYESGLDHTDHAIELLIRAKSCAGTTPFDGRDLDGLTAAWVKRDGIGALLPRLSAGFAADASTASAATEPFSADELDRWLKWAFEWFWDTTVRRFEDACSSARETPQQQKQQAFMLATLRRIVATFGRRNTFTSTWARWRLAQTHARVLGDLDAAQDILEALLLPRGGIEKSGGASYSGPPEEVRPILFAARLTYGDVVYAKFRAEKGREGKVRLLRKLRDLPPLDGDGIEASTLVTMQARMTRVVGDLGKYNEMLDKTFKDCVEGMRDKNADNDCSAFRRLALVLSLMEGMERDAQIAYSLQFSDVDTELSGKNRDSEEHEKKDEKKEEENEENEEEKGGDDEEEKGGEKDERKDEEKDGENDKEKHDGRGGADEVEIERAVADIKERTRPVEQPCGSVDDSAASTSESPSSVIADPDASPSCSNPSNPGEDENCDFIPYRPSTAAKQDIADTYIGCNGCESVFKAWTEPLYLCLICADCDLCSKCYKALKEGTPAEGHSWKYCGKGHRYLRGPVKGWIGVKDGIIKILKSRSASMNDDPQEEAVVFKDWVKGLEQRWEEAWDRFWMDESFVRDILT